MDVQEVSDTNGGNAEVARTKPNLEEMVDTKVMADQTLNSDNSQSARKMDKDEVNGEDKSIGKKLESAVKRRMRKSKSNSTSSVEADAKPKSKGVKRKLLEPDVINDDDSGEFIGFSSESLMIIETGLEILQKLIAEAELEEANTIKRRRTPSKGPQKSLESKKVAESLDKEITDDNKSISTVPEEKPKIKDEKQSEKIDTTVVDSSNIVNNLETEGAPSNNPNVDMSNPLYKEPFKFGWKREMVYKGGFDNPSKRLADIYYYSPKGKKVKSLREVAECLTTKELSLDNFTFYKEPIGVDDPSMEVIRDAKRLRSEFADDQATPAKRIMNKRSSLTRKVLTPSPCPPKTAKVAATKGTTPTGFKVKVASKRGVQKKEVKSSKDTEQRTPQWSPHTVTRKHQATAEKVTSPKNKRILRKKIPPMEVDPRQYFMVSVCAGYHALSRVFQYLKVQELLRAARVCRMWRDLAAHPALWKTVRMKNSQVTDWDGLAASLKRHGTQHLDLRKMLIAGESDNFWEKFISILPNIPNLTVLELCRCPASVVEAIFKSCPQLEVMSAMAIKCDGLNIESLGNVKNLKELRLKAISGMSLQEDFSPLGELKKLTQLNLTSVKELGKKKIEVLGDLVSLEALELGECSDFPDKFGTDVLSKLINLERLRLEKGQGSCCTFDILEGVSKMEKLHQLELVNFDVKNGFDKYLANCKNIKRLLIIPTYISQSATSNNMVLGGVTELSNTLTHFVWGVTLELLRVTELFVDQCNQMHKHVSGDSIPVLKPVPCLKLIEDGEGNPDAIKEEQLNVSNPQVDILSLPQLQKLLLTALPETRVKILKIPFHATWRQSISDNTSP